MRFLVPFVVILVVTVLALISCLSADEGQVRGLPRLVWVVIILLFPLVGAVTYFLVGRPVRSGTRRDTWRPGGGFPESQRPRQVAPDDDPEFLRSIENRRKEDEDLMRRWEEDLRRREDELRGKGDEKPGGSDG